MENTDLENKYPLIDFGEEFNKTKETIYTFDSATSELKSLLNHPVLFISEYFEKLRNQFDLDRELSKKHIDDHFDKSINDLFEQEKECLDNMKIKRNDEMIRRFELDIKRLNNEINVPKVDTKKWRLMMFESMKKISRINLIVENNKIELLRNKSFVFGSILTELKESLNRNKLEILTVCFCLFFVNLRSKITDLPKSPHLLKPLSYYFNF